MEYVETLNSFVPLVVAIAFVFIAVKLAWWSRTKRAVASVHHILELREEVIQTIPRWGVYHEGGDLAGDLHVRSGDTIQWTIPAGAGITRAAISLPSTVFRQINCDDLHENATPGQPLRLRVCLGALPGCYPYCVELHNAAGRMDRFVLGGSHTRLHVDRM